MMQPYLRIQRDFVADLLNPPFDQRFWPEYTYLFFPEWKLLYCPIPKVACTSFKSFFGGLSSRKIAPGKGVHGRAHRAYSLSRLRRRQAFRILRDPKYVRFAFVRNPWDRLVSAYYSKFVNPDVLSEFSLRVIDDVYSREHAIADYEMSISFRNFLSYIARTPDEHLDEHWKPQHLFLGARAPDFLGKFENLESDFRRLASMVNLPVQELPVFNVSLAPEGSPPPEDVRYSPDIAAAALRQLDPPTDFRQLYTADLVELVARRYAEDVARFGYCF